MARVLVLYQGRGGSAARLADAVVEGARSVRFAEADVRVLDAPAADGADADGAAPLHRRLDDATAVAEYDALVLGGPVRDGAMADGVRHFLEGLATAGAAGGLADRVGAVFAVAEGGQAEPEPALVATLAAMGRLGMILAPPGDGGSPLGAVLTTGTPAPQDVALAAARRQGARVARVAEWVRHAKGHEHGSGHGGGHHHHH